MPDNNMTSSPSEIDLRVTSLVMNEFAKFQEHLREALDGYDEFTIRINTTLQKYGEDRSQSSKLILEDNGTQLISIIRNGDNIED